MGSRLLTSAVLVLALINVGLFVAVLTRDDGGSATGGGTIASASPAAGSTAGSTASPTARPTASPTASPTAESTAQAATTRDVLLLTRTAFVARPFRAVPVTGVWRPPSSGMHRKVRVEVRRAGRWSPFPLPAAADAKGRFTAYLDLGAPGRYRLRVVGDGGGPVSAPFTVTVR